MPRGSNRGGTRAEFADAQLGDARRSERLLDVVEALDRNPALSFPKAMGSDAALEGTYRLLSNPDVSAVDILAPHQRATGHRVAGQREIIIAHDTTTIAFAGKSTRAGLGPIAEAGQGFFAHVSLAILAGEERLPLGILASKTWVRAAEKKPKIRPEKRSLDPERESKRWYEQVEAAESQVPAGTRVIHVIDREGDAYELLSRMHEGRRSYVVRAAHDRRLLGDQPLLSDLLGSLKHRCEREVPLSRRVGSAFPRSRAQHPPRHGRIARLAFSASCATFERPRYALKDLAGSITVNIVHVQELETPPGEKPVEWILFTSEPISTPAEILRVVDIYRARWTIEELFKCLKTGCSIEERQLESLHALENALAIFLPIAWRLLTLRSLSRQPDDVPAEFALTTTQIDVLRAVAKQPLARSPSAKQALLAIAALGGHIKNNGVPGWQVIGRGYHDLLLLELGWLARDERCDQ